uniref:DUF6864 domain-containing function n=1 Tax=Paraburkholderia sp. 22B1P TaxID=3080498 RepID=UPI00403F4A2B
MKIFNGDFEILDSGTVASPNLSDTRFVVSEDPPMEVVFRISMSGDESGISLEALNANTIALVFKKPSSLGFGPASPVKVGRLNGRLVYVSFSVSMRGTNDSYSLDYTFYLGGTV